MKKIVEIPYLQLDSASIFIYLFFGFGGSGV
jgi:hypothetical protein